MKCIFGLFAVVLALTGWGCQEEVGLPMPAENQEPAWTAELPDSEALPEPEESGASVIPSVSAVIPNIVYLDRIQQVLITGSATEWDDTAVVDFGPGVTVLDMLVASPAGIVAIIEVSGEAEVGFRSVTVSQDTELLTYSFGFAVLPRIAGALPAGSLTQGSILVGEVQLLDTSRIFEPQNIEDMTVRLGEYGSRGIVFDSSSYSLSYVTFIDVLAPLGPTDLIIESPEEIWRIPDFFEITERTPAPLTLDASMTVTMSEPFATHVYQLSPTPGSTFVARVSTDNPDIINPTILILPESGRFEDQITTAGGNQFVSAEQVGNTAYVVVWDTSGTAGYTYTLEILSLDLDETEPNNDATTAIQVGAAPAMLEGLINPPGDRDLYAVSLTAGQVITASTEGTVLDQCGPAGNIESDLRILGPDGTELAFNDDRNEDYCSRVQLVAPADGIYYLDVGASAAYCERCAFTYNLKIEIVTLAADQNEPNNDISAATQVSAMPAVLSGVIGAPGDRDFYAVSLTAGQTITASTEGTDLDKCSPAGNIESDIRLLGPDGTELAVNDDRDEDYCSRVQFVAPADGIYYLDVGASVAYCPTCVFSYALSIQIQ